MVLVVVYSACAQTCLRPPHLLETIKMGFPLFVCKSLMLKDAPRWCPMVPASGPLSVCSNQPGATALLLRAVGQQLFCQQTIRVAGPRLFALWLAPCRVSILEEAGSNVWWWPLSKMGNTIIYPNMLMVDGLYYKL